ncbi:PQQ-binding-like beta-propeller repeat protein [Halovenus sp. HT40]|uniref:PQQ-binding-like beta-propeller repeat protein n=1 Tax=Halovenus sp. HT40 TaxID=3126691 RepID=UPI00300EBC97
MTARRRTLLRVGLAATTGGLAGCSIFGGDGGNPSTDDEKDSQNPAVPTDEWHSLQRTPANDGVAAETTVPADPTERWRITLPAAVDCQPVVGEDSLFVITRDGTLHALETTTGETVWTESLGDTRTKCPAIVGETVVVGTGNGQLRAFDQGSGDTTWTIDTPGVPGDPTPYGDTVYVGTDDGTLLGIDAPSADVRTRIDAGEAVITPPAVTDQLLYVGCGQDMLDNEVFAFGRGTGTEQWRAESFGPQAVVATEYRIVTVRRDGLYLYNHSGEIRGQSSASIPPAATGEVLYTGGGTVSPISLVEGGPDWVHWLEKNTDAQPEVTGGMSLGETTLCVPYANFDGETPEPVLLGLSTDSGNQQWKRALPDGFPTAPVLADEGIFVGTDSGTLLALD